MMMQIITRAYYNLRAEILQIIVTISPLIAQEANKWLRAFSKDVFLKAKKKLDCFFFLVP